MCQKKYILENLYQGPKGHSLNYDSRGMPKGMYTVLRYDWRKQERGLVGYIVPFRPLLAKQLTKERAHCAEANASRMAGSQGVVWSVCTL